MGCFAVIVSVGGIVAGWSAGGPLGALTGLVTGTLILASMVQAARPGPPGLLPPFLVGTLQLLATSFGAVLGTWSFGWLLAPAGFFFASVVAMGINMVIAQMQWRARSRDEDR